jgi:hypothetical protein
VSAGNGETRPLFEETLTAIKGGPKNYPVGLASLFAGLVFGWRDFLAEYKRSEARSVPVCRSDLLESNSIRHTGRGLEPEYFGVTSHLLHGTTPMIHIFGASRSLTGYEFGDVPAEA